MPCILSLIGIKLMAPPECCILYIFIWFLRWDRRVIRGRTNITGHHQHSSNRNKLWVNNWTNGCGVYWKGKGIKHRSLHYPTGKVVLIGLFSLPWYKFWKSVGHQADSISSSHASPQMSVSHCHGKHPCPGLKRKMSFMPQNSLSYFEIFF